MTPRTLDRGEASARLDSALEALGRRKWIAIFVFAAVFSATTSVTRALPDIYRATATVLVERQQVSEAFVTSVVTAELETRIQTIQQEVMSRGRLSELIARFDLYPGLRAKAPLEAVIDRMRRDVQLELKGIPQAMSGRSGTIAFAVIYRGREPHTVATVANALARLYVEENTKIREGQAVQTADFLRDQLADLKAELDAHDRRTSAFKLSHIGELPQQIEANLASLERLNTQLRLNGENQIRAMDRRERFEKQLADIESAAPAPPPVVSARSEQLAKLRQQLREAQSRFTDAYPEVIRLRNEITTLEQRSAEEAPASTSTAPHDPAPRIRQAIDDADAELRTLKDEELSLRQATTGYEQRVDNVPKRQEEYQALSRDYDATRERYDSLLKRYEQAQLAESLEQGKKMEQFRVLDAAIPPRDPAAPPRLRLLVLGFIAAIGLAAGVVIGAEKLNTSFHDIDDVRAFVTGAMVVRVPLILTPAERRKHRLRFLALAVSAAVVLVLIVAGSHYLANGNEQIVRLMERGNV